MCQWCSGAACTWTDSACGTCRYWKQKTSTKVKKKITGHSSLHPMWQSTVCVKFPKHSGQLILSFLLFVYFLWKQNCISTATYQSHVLSGSSYCANKLNSLDLEVFWQTVLCNVLTALWLFIRHSHKPDEESQVLLRAQKSLPKHYQSPECESHSYLTAASFICIGHGCALNVEMICRCSQTKPQSSLLLEKCGCNGCEAIRTAWPCALGRLFPVEVKTEQRHNPFIASNQNMCRLYYHTHPEFSRYLCLTMKSGSLRPCPGIPNSSSLSSFFLQLLLLLSTRVCSGVRVGRTFTNWFLPAACAEIWNALHLPDYDKTIIPTGVKLPITSFWTVQCTN